MILVRNNRLVRIRGKATDSETLRDDPLIVMRHALADRWFAKYRKEMYKQLSAQILESSKLVAGGSTEPTTDAMEVRWTRDFLRVKRPLVTAMVRSGTELTDSVQFGKSMNYFPGVLGPDVNPFASVGLKGKADPVGLEVIGYDSDDVFLHQAQTQNVEAYLQATSKKETATSRKKIDKLYKDANSYWDEKLQRGFTPKQMAKAMTQQGLADSVQRANLMSRTTTMWAYNEGAKQSYINAGIPVMSWVTSNDDALCFPAGTGIRTKSGSQPIEKIKIGDIVLSADGFNKVIRTGKRKYNGRFVFFSTNNEFLICTEEHPIYILGCGWTEAKDIKLGNKVKLFNNQTANVIRFVHIPLSDTNDSPSILAKISRLSFITFRVLVPVISIGFKNYFRFCKGKINRIFSYFSFLNKRYLQPFKSFSNRSFQSRFSTIPHITRFRTKTSFHPTINYNYFAALLAHIGMLKTCPAFPAADGIPIGNCFGHRERFGTYGANFGNHLWSMGKIITFFITKFSTRHTIRTIKSFLAIFTSNFFSGACTTVITFVRTILMRVFLRSRKYLTTLWTMFLKHFISKIPINTFLLTKLMGCTFDSCWLSVKSFPAKIALKLKRFSWSSDFITFPTTKLTIRSAIRSIKLFLTMPAFNFFSGTSSSHCFTFLRILYHVYTGKSSVFNLQIEKSPTYFANNVLVHNCEFCVQMDGQMIRTGDPFIPAGTELIGIEGGSLNIPEEWSVGHPPLHPLCFPGNVKVATKEGEVPIKDLQIGDMVMSLSGYHRVDQKHERDFTGELVCVTVELGMDTGWNKYCQVPCTPDHPFIIRGEKGSEIREAQGLKPGDLVYQLAGSFGVVKEIKKALTQSIKVYNLAVEKESMYFANGILVHNCRCTVVPIIVETDVAIIRIAADKVREDYTKKVVDGTLKDARARRAKLLRTRLKKKPKPPRKKPPTKREPSPFAETKETRKRLEKKKPKIPEEKLVRVQIPAEYKAPKPTPRPEITKEELERVLNTERRLAKSFTNEHSSLIDPKTGEVVLRKEGTVDTLRYSRSEIKMHKGRISVHNHPKNAAFSTDDIMFFAQHGMLEEQVISNKFIYKMSRLKGQKVASPTKIKRLYHKKLKELAPKFAKKYRGLKISLDDASAELSHNAWRAVSKDIGMKYRRIRI